MKSKYVEWNVELVDESDKQFPYGDGSLLTKLRRTIKSVSEPAATLKASSSANGIDD